MSVRQQRLELADLRAKEEERMRADMHGLYGSGKHFYGAGATPSMGLSQFRGGKSCGGKRAKCPACKRVKCKCEKSSSDEDEMHGGAPNFASLLGSLGKSAVKGVTRVKPDQSWIRGLTSATRTPASALGALRSGTSTALVPYVPRVPTSTALTHFTPSIAPRAPLSLVPYVPPRVSAPSTSTALTTGLARPSFPRSYYERLLRPAARPSAPAPPRLTNVAAKPTLMGRLGSLGKGVTASRVLTALALGLPLASLGIALGADGVDENGAYFPSAGEGEAGDEEEEEKRREEERPEEDEGLPTGGPGGMDGMPGGMPANVDLPAGMTEGDLAWYLQSGRLPKDMARRLKKQLGGAKKKQSGSNGRSARAQIVAKVMRERGVSLPQASRIVKQEGLY